MGRSVQLSIFLRLAVSFRSESRRLVVTYMGTSIGTLRSMRECA